MTQNAIICDCLSESFNDFQCPKCNSIRCDQCNLMISEGKHLSTTTNNNNNNNNTNTNIIIS